MEQQTCALPQQLLQACSHCERSILEPPDEDFKASPNPGHAPRSIATAGRPGQGPVDGGGAPGELSHARARGAGACICTAASCSVCLPCMQPASLAAWRMPHAAVSLAACRHHASPGRLPPLPSPLSPSIFPPLSSISLILSPGLPHVPHPRVDQSGPALGCNEILQREGEVGRRVGGKRK